MQRIALSLAALGVLALSLTGCCCCGHGGYGAGYAPACPPANPCAPPMYGAMMPGAPMVSAPGSCPTGNCGMYPSATAFYGPTTAAVPGVYATAAVPMDPLPTF